MQKNSNIPLYLTLFRLIVSPFIFPFILWFFVQQDIFFFNALLAFLFLVIGFTDFLDGHLARKWGLESSMGKMLDHIADKVLIASTLIVLVAVNKFWFFWAILLIVRELFVAGLRQVSCEHTTVIHVSWLGKAKTGLQIVLCAWVIANPEVYHQILPNFSSTWNNIQLILTLLTISVSWWSAYGYYRVFAEKN